MISGFSASSEEWKNIYESEKQELFETKEVNKDYATSSPSEFFAEILGQAILHPDECQEMTPKAYAFVMDCLSKIEENDDQAQTTEPTPVQSKEPVKTPTPAPTNTPEPVSTATPEPASPGTNSTQVITPDPNISAENETTPSPDPVSDQTTQQEPEATDDQENNIVINPGQYDTKNSDTASPQSSETTSE